MNFCYCLYLRMYVLMLATKADGKLIHEHELYLMYGEQKFGYWNVR